ncbi:hypothetical protein HZA43_00955 [Candidatus Peregrinibacteria bacterium]|nr:hypothetical protein [Candidatus Peregrinibacteria bacterium]
MPPCIVCKTPFEVRDLDRAFYTKIEVPEPKFCPDCRFQQRLCFRNERTLYKRKSSLSGTDMISIYSPENRYKVFTPQEWWGDQWDGMNYGREFDFNRPFFDQFQELLLDVPRIGLFNVNPTNSDYCQQAYNCKNCYLCIAVKNCEDSMYISHSNRIKSSFDCSHTQNMELCYDCVDSDNLYDCVHCQSCQNSSGLRFCYDCIGCHDCFGSWGLRNKRNYIFNKPYSPEEYKQKIASLELFKYSNFVKYKNYFQDVSKKAIHRADRNLNTFDSLGNYLINTQNCHRCFDGFELQDCAYSTWIFESRDCHDVYGMGESELIYQGLGVEEVNHCAFNTFVSNSSDVDCSDLCFYSMNLFGCASLKNKKHCIFNKQYSKEDYFNLKPLIINHMGKTGEWGRFFPVSLSPFAYNETVANKFFPLEKDQALQKGYRWRDLDRKEFGAAETTIPDSIKDVKDDIVNATLSCETTKRKYKVTLQELKFYRDHGIPIPRHCPDQRYVEQMSLRNPRTLYDRNCAKCSAPLKTTYAPERPEIVYCEKCYLKEVY